MSNSQMEQARELARQQGVLRPRDLAARGLPGAYLGRLAQGDSLNAWTAACTGCRSVELTEQHTLAEVRRVPQGMVCLLSTLRLFSTT